MAWALYATVEWRITTGELDLLGRDMQELLDDYEDLFLEYSQVLNDQQPRDEKGRFAPKKS